MSNITIPTGWNQTPWPFTSAAGNKTTIATTGGVSTTTDTSLFTRNKLVSWDATGKTQIDDIIGALKTTVTGSGGTEKNFYAFNHWIQFATSTTIA